MINPIIDNTHHSEFENSTSFHVHLVFFINSLNSLAKVSSNNLLMDILMKLSIGFKHNCSCPKNQEDHT